VYKKIKEYLLNCPEKYWVVVFGYHFKKSFLGTVLLLVGIFLASLFLIIAGLFFICLGIAGHIYTNRKSYFKLWEKYEKK